MKKNYIKPESIAVELKLNKQIMAGSVTENAQGEVESVGGGGNYTGNEGGILSRSFGFGDEE